MVNTLRQLHSDLEKVATKSSGQFADPVMLTLFNANLAMAKKEYGDDPVIGALPAAQGQVRVGDLLVRVGQLMVAVEENGPILLSCL